MDCEKCGEPLLFVKSWEIKGKGFKEEDPHPTEISLYKCKNGHIKRTGKRL